MSQENVEIVRRAIAAWNGRDIEAMPALTDPEGWEVDRLYDRGDEIVGLGRISRPMPGSDLGFGQAEVRAALEAVGLSE